MVLCLPAGTAVFSIVNLIFITQSLSTLDSTFTSAAKLMGPEFSGATGRTTFVLCKLWPLMALYCLYR